MKNNNKIKSILFLLVILVLPAVNMASSFDASPSWPLCGRVSEEAPTESGWQMDEKCPAERIGSAQYNDFPISSTFGPRQLVSEDYRYDFHRGIDIPTPIDTPVFAIADGIVKKAGKDESYNDPIIILRHFRSGYTGTSCSKSGGCYHSLYLHMNTVEVNKNDHISKGDLIGYSGASESGFEHLHFEIRQAPSNDPYSYWQRDSIHPLKILPYTNQSKNNMLISIESVNQFGTQLQVTAKVSIPMDELDLLRIEATVYDNTNGQLISQSGNNKNENGYHVEPAWFDVEVWNQEYTHKNSSKVTWESFGAGGSRECPYNTSHEISYDANIHMDKAEENDQIADFNGILIAPDHYNANSSEYLTSYTFKELIGANGGIDDSCIVIEAVDIQGTTKFAEFNCAN